MDYRRQSDPTTARQSYSDDDAKRILLAARRQKEAHKRWVPWLAAYTGARCDEPRSERAHQATPLPRGCRREQDLRLRLSQHALPSTQARVRPLTVNDDDHDWHRAGESLIRPLKSFDAVMMRKDPPFDMEYVYTTYLLEAAEGEGALVLNRPRAVRDHNEKMAISRFSEFTAPTLVTRNPGMLSGTPTTPGAYLRGINVIDSGNNTGSIAYSGTVLPAQSASAHGLALRRHAP